jgi:hypothetical protein
MFKAEVDRKAILELRTFTAFRTFLDKLKTEKERCYQGLLTCPADEVVDRRAYLRALDDIISSIST